MQPEVDQRVIFCRRKCNFFYAGAAWNDPKMQLRSTGQKSHHHASELQGHSD